ncbi:MAG: hypothetical protein LBV49_13230 [Azonexus sp.]|jgi:hypothetical protein|nr:hypothetical protein [Azonexus sp.]
MTKEIIEWVNSISISSGESSQNLTVLIQASGIKNPVKHQRHIHFPAFLSVMPAMTQAAKK